MSASLLRVITLQTEFRRWVLLFPKVITAIACVSGGAMLASGIESIFESKLGLHAPFAVIGDQERSNRLQNIVLGFDRGFTLTAKVAVGDDLG